MNKRYLMAFALLPVLLTGYISGDNKRADEIKAVENEPTLKQQVTHLSIYNHGAQNYHSLHIYDLIYRDGYTFNDFANHVLESYCVHNQDKTEKNTSDGDMWWKYNGDANEKNDFLICLGSTGDIGLPLWVEGFKMQAVKYNPIWTAVKTLAKDDMGKDIQYDMAEDGNVTLNIKDDYIADVPTINFNVHCYTQVPWKEVLIDTQKISRLDKIKLNLRNLKDKGYYYTTSDMYDSNTMLHKFDNAERFYKSNVEVYITVNTYEDLGYVYVQYPNGWANVKYYTFSMVGANNEMVWDIEKLPNVDHCLGLNFNNTNSTIMRIPLTKAMPNVTIFEPGENNIPKRQFELKNMIPNRFYESKDYSGDYPLNTEKEYKACDLIFKINKSMYAVKADGEIKQNSICGLNAKDISDFIKQYDALGDAKIIFDVSKQNTYNHLKADEFKDYSYLEIMNQLKNMNEGNTLPLLGNVQLSSSNTNVVIISTSILTLVTILGCALILFKRKQA